MNKQELRDKIIGIVLDVPITGIKIREILGGEAAANSIADALISADIGDVSELQKECDSKEEAYNKCYSDYKYWKDRAKEYEYRAEMAEVENAELKARLEKAVELPRIVHPNPNEWFVQYEMKSGLLDYLIFYSKQAAEACLAELREEK